MSLAFPLFRTLVSSTFELLDPLWFFLIGFGRLVLLGCCLVMMWLFLTL